MNPRNRRAWLLAGLLLTVGFAAFRFAAGRVEAMIAARMDAAALRAGLSLHIDALHVGLFPPVRLSGITIERPGQWSARIDQVSARPRWRGSSMERLAGRVTIGEARVTLPAEMGFQTHRTVWDVEPRGSAVLRSPVEGLILTTGSGPSGKTLDLRVSQLAIDQVGSLLLGGEATQGVGLVDGEIHWEGQSPENFRAKVRMQALGAVIDGTASSALHRLAPMVTFAVAIAHLDFARLFRALGIDMQGAEDLGALSGTMSGDGSLADLDTLLIKQDFKFTPPRLRPAQIARLRSDFTHEVTTNTGARKIIRVSADSPDFVAAADVPARFIRTLLIAEDAAFFSHPGVDFTELPKAIATNMARGEAARGGSTISQQLAKNLFLTREKSLRRKLKELAFAFLLESTLSKPRILEIYLNVIEWGPGLYGLKPAAREYFDKDPWNLTPKEIAFLVALIPGPVKYQRSFADGGVRSGFETLVTNLLFKMRSIDVITEEQFQAALAETLAVRGHPPELEPPEPAARGPRAQ